MRTKLIIFTIFLTSLTSLNSAPQIKLSKAVSHEITRLIEGDPVYFEPLPLHSKEGDGWITIIDISYNGEKYHLVIKGHYTRGAVEDLYYDGQIKVSDFKPGWKIRYK